MVSLSIIIPAYNEEHSLRIFLPQVIDFCKQRDYKLIVVNDGSTDGTKKILSEYLNDRSTLTVLHNKVNSGYGAAIKRGVREATTDFIITIDADGQHSLDDVDRLFKTAIDEDADMVVGNRGVSSTFYRNIGKWLIRTVTKILMPLDIHDINSGMKLYNTELAKKYISICPETMAYSDIILLTFVYQKCRVIEIPITIKPRTQGVSTINTMTAINTLRELVNIVVLFNPIVVFFPLGMFCIVASVIWGIHISIAGKGISTGTLLGVLTGILILFIGLLSHQISAFRKEKF